jgi:hypothetical protein
VGSNAGKAGGESTRLWPQVARVAAEHPILRKSGFALDTFSRSRPRRPLRIGQDTPRARTVREYVPLRDLRRTLRVFRRLADAHQLTVFANQVGLEPDRPASGVALSFCHMSFVPAPNPQPF